MDSIILARENHKFLYVDFPLGIFEEDGYFNHVVRRAAKIYSEKLSLENRFGKMSFSCQNGEFGYIQISGKSAKLINDGMVDFDKVLHRIPRSIQGDHNDHCIILLNGVEVTIRIVAYEGAVNGKLSLIKDPTDNAVSDETPLGRVVIITANLQGKEVPEDELVNSWVQSS